MALLGVLNTISCHGDDLWSAGLSSQGNTLLLIMVTRLLAVLALLLCVHVHVCTLVCLSEVHKAAASVFSKTSEFLVVLQVTAGLHWVSGDCSFSLVHHLHQ